MSGTQIIVAIVIVLLGFFLNGKLEVIRRQQAEILHARLNIYNRQLEILKSIYKPLRDIEFYLQRLTSPVKIAGEESNDYLTKIQSTRIPTYDAFIDGRLFLPEKLSENIELFFNRVSDSLDALDVAIYSGPGEERAKQNREARTIAHKEIVNIRKAIEKQAQDIINERMAHPSAKPI